MLILIALAALPGVLAALTMFSMVALLLGVALHTDWRDGVRA